MVDRIVDGQRTDARALVGRVVAAAGQHGIDRGERRLLRPQSAGQTDADPGEVASARIKQIGTRLQVARILGRTAFDQTRVGIADEKRGVPGRDVALDHFLHRTRVFVETDGVVENGLRVPDGQWLVIRKEISPVREIELRDFVIAAMNGIIRPLEEPVFAIVDELHPGQARGLRVEQRGETLAGHQGGSGDVVFHLDLDRGEVVFAQPEGAP